MDLMVLDTDLKAVAVVDTYKSIIWTDRYQKPGDFELYTAMSTDLLSFIKQDYYLVNRDSEHAMIIEALRIQSDAELGNSLTVTGRSLESILDRRVIWGQMTVNGDFQNGIKKLLDACIISPSDSDRKIGNFIFKASTDPKITELTIDAQYTGDNLLEVIEKLCSENDIGFKVTLNDVNQFVFELYAGADRTYDQTEHPYVVFSPKFENIINSNYIESKSAMKNVTLVGGEGEGSERRYTRVGTKIGLDRREMFTDARDISSKIDNDVTLTDDAYIALLRQRGSEDLAENKDIISFEGQIETRLMFNYGDDFFMGDIVQITNEYGHEGKVRVLELVMSEDQEGISVYPTFATIDEEGEAE